jgi:DNA polymerase-3 subunit delta'
LVELVQHNRLSHALLFLGKEGNGSLQLAIALAQYLTCEKANPKKQTPSSDNSLFGEITATNNQQPVTINDSCGVCASCIKAKQLVHPDIHFFLSRCYKKIWFTSYQRRLYL